MTEKTKHAARSSVPPLSIDDMDRGIIQALQRDIKTSNKRIAQELEVAESTVAARIRAMSDRGIMRVLAETDMVAFGYKFVTFLGIKIHGRVVDEVAAELVSIDEVASLVAAVGRYDLIAMILAEDATHYDVLLNEKIGQVEGIKHIEPTLATEIFMQSLDYAVLGEPS
ncbi:MAG: Lrp/AsnC family transcriptional regulator [Alphaproteobacteria bacterium]